MDRSARFNYGFSSFKGKRASMEDFFETEISKVDGQMVAFFGVFDGHGGSRTAEYLKTNLFKNLTRHPDFITDTKRAIVEAFRQTYTVYLNEEKGQQKDAGSTASTALLLGDRLFVANVGDSRVVACRAGSAIPLSIDHKPDRSDERERIEQARGFIIWASKLLSWSYVMHDEIFDSVIPSRSGYVRGLGLGPKSTGRGQKLGFREMSSIKELENRGKDAEQLNEELQKKNRRIKSKTRLNGGINVGGVKS